jgi:uncharacterized protein YoxC
MYIVTDPQKIWSFLQDFFSFCRMESKIARKEFFTMDIVLYSSVALIAIAFLVLVIYVVQTLKTLQTTLQHVAKTVEEVEKQMHEIGKETAQLLHKTNALADDMHKKAESLQSVFDAVKQVGVTVQSFNDSICKTLATNEKKITQAIQWGQTLIELWTKWKGKRK